MAGAHANRLHARLAIVLSSLAGAFLIALFFEGMPASADEPADQLDRARLVRKRQPLAGGGTESQWHAQTFERERQAQDLSADILRRDQEYRQGMRH